MANAHEYVTESQGSHDVMQMFMVAAPAWLGSAVIHGVIILMMMQIQWSVGGDVEKRPVQASIKEELAEVIEQAPEPEKPQIEETVVDDLAPSDSEETTETAATGGSVVDDNEMDQPVGNAPGFNVPGFNEGEPDEAPPLQIAKLALGEAGAPGHFHGIYGSRGGSGKRKALIRHGGTKQSENTVVDTIGWLARVQEADGRWDSVKWGAGGNVDPAVTGLALLAFLGHGETDGKESKYRDTVRRALEWLDKQSPAGTWDNTFYTQGICTMALCEAYGLTRSEKWGKAAQRALDFLTTNMNPNGGWDYGGNNPAKVDTSVTGWCMMAMKSGIASELKVSPQSIEAIKKWLRESVNADGTTGYTKNIGAQGSSGGTPPMTAVAVLGKLFFGWPRDSEELQKGLNYLSKQGPNIQNEYYYYYGTLCMFQAGGALWDQWNKALREPLIAAQVKNRGPEFDGSWDPTGTFGAQGGRVYQTAMAVFTLEVYYRFLPVLK